MKLTIIKKIGRTEYPFTFEGNDLHEVLMESEKLSFGNVNKCGLCDNEYLFLSAYITKEDNFKYVKISCPNCRASVTFGRKKENPDVYYLRKTDSGELDWQAYKGEPSKPEISENDKIFYDKCSKLVEADSDNYFATLNAFENGKYTSAKAIPVSDRDKFLKKFNENDEEIPF